MFAVFLLATEIQNIQIADGDVCPGLPIPIFMIFPRLFTCPTLQTNNFKVGKYIYWISDCLPRPSYSYIYDLPKTVYMSYITN